MTIDIVPLTPERWQAFADLFGVQGACYGCWCTYFRLAPKERKQNDRDANKAFIKARIMVGPPPGVLAMDGGRAIGWLQVGPRADVPQWNSPRRVSAPLDDAPPDDASVWAMSCFFVAKDARRRGVTRRLVEGGVEFARANGARLVEACPIAHSKSPLGLFVGAVGVFREAEFTEITSRKDNRPLMRKELI
ncbi:MAG: GNAT family N-acetyltransferase [Rhizobiaceae bacterium]